MDNATTPDFCASDIVIDPSGKFVYIALEDLSFGHGMIAAYKTNSGHLTPVAAPGVASDC